MATQTIRLASFLAPSIRPVYEAVADLLAERLGVRTELIVGTSFDQFAGGEVDAGFI